MGHLAKFDEAALRRALAGQDGVITRTQAHGCGMSDPAIRHRIRPEGPWQIVLPGTYILGQGVPTSRQRAISAYLYAGHPLAITGPAALRFYSLPSVPTELVDVLVPLECRRRDTRFARLHRTSVTPEVARSGVLRYASPARAVADTVRDLSQLADVRAVVAGGVQRGKVSIADLVRELDAGQIRGSAQLRLALAEVADGIRSSAEGDLRGLILRSGLPMPMFNARLTVGGELIAVVDAWWPEAGVAVEVDSREWHLSPAGWARTLERHARMTALGVLVLHFAPRRIRLAGTEVTGEIRATLTRGRALPDILAAGA